MTTRIRDHVCVLLLLLTGCGGYGDVSYTTYRYAQALYSITNRRAAEKLDQVTTQIDSARSSGQLSKREARWLEEIIADAREGNWQHANLACRTMMEDQVKNTP